MSKGKIVALAVAVVLAMVSGSALAGGFGRKAGTVPGFHKYKGLKGSDIVWDDTTMDQWLANPKKFLGKKTSMVYKLKNVTKRADVIEYMKTIE
jgi:cytochrome c